MTELNNIAILGAGTMGSQIGLCFAVAGCRVLLKEPELVLAEKGKARLAGLLDKSIEKGQHNEEFRDGTLERIIPVGEYDQFGDVDLVIEAVFEDVELKKKLLAKVDSVCKPDCIIASNTSSIPITLLSTAVARSRRPRFIGAHFFAPAFIMKLVEIIPGLETSGQTVTDLLQACERIGKKAVKVKDTAGFVVNRMLFAFFAEAVRLLDEGVASCEDIDAACRLGLGHPIGPFALMDMADLTMALDIGNFLKDAHGDRFRFGNALHQKVYAGHLGRRTGHGWHSYTEEV